MASWRTDPYFPVLRRKYDEQDETLDRLPYTKRFDDMIVAFNAETGKHRTPAACFHELLGCRKANKNTPGKLAKKGRNGRTFRPDRLTDDGIKVLADLYLSGRRCLDSLAYTGEFDAICKAFKDRTGVRMNHLEIWQSLQWMRRHDHLPTKTDRKPRKRKA